MKVKIINEAGYDEALFGLGLSHGMTSGMTFEDFMYYEPMEVDPVSLGITHEPVTSAEFEHMEHVAQKLAGKGNGHDKFLRQIMVWLDCVCPRYFWPELDQYKVATVTQSESTMHTITKREFDRSMFDTQDCCADHLNQIINVLNALREDYKDAKDGERKKRLWYMIIQLLPQSYLQRRILTCSYATLRNIIEQRKGHKLSEWAIFINAVREQVQHPELLP